MKEEEIQRGTAITTEEYNKLKEKADAFDFLFGEEGIKVGNAMKLWIWRNKIEAAKTILYDFCDYYGTETCREGICDVDPSGWEGCLTRQVLEILEIEEG